MSRVAGLDPGRSKCGLVLVDTDAACVETGFVLPRDEVVEELVVRARHVARHHLQAEGFPHVAGSDRHVLQRGRARLAPQHECRDASDRTKSRFDRTARLEAAAAARSACSLARCV